MLALLLAAVAAGLAIVASGPGHSLPGFWLLWGVMVIALCALLLHRAAALARHAAPGRTAVDHALWIAAEVAGVLAILALILAALP